MIKVFHLKVMQIKVYYPLIWNPRPVCFKLSIFNLKYSVATEFNFKYSVATGFNWKYNVASVFNFKYSVAKAFN